MIRWGILGAGKVARRFVRSVRQEPDSRLEAVSGRSQANAEAFASAYGIPRCFGTYEELLDDPRTDAVYLALPMAAIKSGR